MPLYLVTDHDRWGWSRNVVRASSPQEAPSLCADDLVHAFKPPILGITGESLVSACGGVHVVQRAAVESDQMCEACTKYAIAWSKGE